MQEAAVKGIILGLTLAALIGPVFFSLLQTSLHRGFRAGAFMAVGISLSDTLYIFLTNFFFSFLDNSPRLGYFLGLFGGFVLLGVGILTLLKRPVNTTSDTDSAGNNLSRLRTAALIGRGFLMNFAHPGVLIFWLSIITLINTTWDFPQQERVLLFGCTILTVFLTDLLKALLAHSIKHLLTPAFLLWMNRTMGVILMLFGMHLFFSTLFDF
jgi:threonine/homoserine/homoserine lactone efflux protein